MATSVISESCTWQPQKTSDSTQNCALNSVIVISLHVRWELWQSTSHNARYWCKCRHAAATTRVEQNLNWRFQPQIAPSQICGHFLWTVISKNLPRLIRSIKGFGSPFVATSLKRYGGGDCSQFLPCWKRLILAGKTNISFTSRVGSSTAGHTAACGLVPRSGIFVLKNKTNFESCLWRQCTGIMFFGRFLWSSLKGKRVMLSHQVAVKYVVTLSPHSQGKLAKNLKQIRYQNISVPRSCIRTGNLFTLDIHRRIFRRVKSKMADDLTEIT